MDLDCHWSAEAAKETEMEEKRVKACLYRSMEVRGRESSTSLSTRHVIAKSASVSRPGHVLTFELQYSPTTQRV